MHNELESLREKLSKAERLNEYLKKQIEIHHITHGNIDLLMEMAQELNFTKEELEAYKDKLARTKDIRDSLIKAANSKSLSGLFNYLAFILETTSTLQSSAYSITHHKSFMHVTLLFFF